MVIPQQDKIERYTEGVAKTLAQLVAWCREQAWPELAQSLWALEVPVASAPSEVWSVFDQDFRAAMQPYFDRAPAWRLSHEQLGTVADYFYANKLLLDCLELASVSDREGIENSLFLPSGES